VLRINVFIINIDTSEATRKNPEGMKFNVNEYKSYYPDIKFLGDDELDLHD
jgi:hypothetical protein